MLRKNIIQNIADRLKSENLNLTPVDIEVLIASTINTIDKCLSEGYSVDIEDFGLFRRRKSGGAISYTSFSAVERVGARIK